MGDQLNWLNNTPPERLNAENIAIVQLNNVGVASQSEIELFRKDGSRVPVMAGVAMLDYPKVISIVVDLTELTCDSGNQPN